MHFHLMRIYFSSVLCTDYFRADSTSTAIGLHFRLFAFFKKFAHEISNSFLDDSNYLTVLLKISSSLKFSRDFEALSYVPQIC